MKNQLILLLALCCIGNPVAAEEDGETVLKSWGDFIVGGTWTTTVGGDQKEHTYEWMQGGKFLRLTAKDTQDPGVAIIGVDPDTGKTTFWIFDEDGDVSRMTLSLEGNGVWKGVRRTNGSHGVVTAELKATRTGDNQLEVVVDSEIDGIKQPTRKTTWKRNK